MIQSRWGWESACPPPRCCWHSTENNQAPIFQTPGETLIPPVSPPLGHINCSPTGMDSVAIHPHALALLPFVVLLATIALAPLFFADWWGRNYPKVCLALAAIVIVYYCFGLNAM